jgi:hypothetical protein
MNPCRLKFEKKDGSKLTLREALHRYRRYVRQHPELIDELYTLSGKRLGCWCVKESKRTMKQDKRQEAEMHDNISSATERFSSSYFRNFSARLLSRCRQVEHIDFSGGDGRVSE